nr:MAG TPA: hypothetical protein [Caudoviricetes sp.]
MHGQLNGLSGEHFNLYFCLFFKPRTPFICFFFGSYIYIIFAIDHTYNDLSTIYRIRAKCNENSPTCIWRIF